MSNKISTNNLPFWQTAMIYQKYVHKKIFWDKFCQMDNKCVLPPSPLRFCKLWCVLHFFLLFFDDLITSNDILYCNRVNFPEYNGVRIMVFDSTFNNISVISWRPILLLEETAVLWENHWPVASHWQTLSSEYKWYCLHVQMYILHLLGKPPRHNRNIVESGVKHHNSY
jgi:hypothetical protein